jgi:membrane protein DedA with SNARE-associated domain
MTDIIQFFEQNAFLGTVLVFLIAFGEAFILSCYFLPGTLLTVGFGALVRIGYIPVWIAFASWAGTLFGDLCSYLLARYITTWLHKVGSLTKIIECGQNAFVNRPAFFMLTSRFSPYLKSTAPTIAGISRFPPGAFILLEILASGLDAGFFLTIGYLGASVATDTDVINRITSFIGLIVAFLLVCLLVREFPDNRLLPNKRKSLQPNRRGLLFKMRCLFLLVPWNVCGKVEELLRFWNRKCFRRMALNCLSNAQKGDIVLLARDYSPPWGGIWTHAALVTSSQDDGLVIHAYEGRVIEESYASLPKRCRMSIIRISANSRIIDHAITEARNQLGKRFSLTAHKEKNTTPSKFNCAGLVWFSFAKAGIDLVPGDDTIVTPQDLYDSSFVKVICNLYCPAGSSRSRYIGNTAKWPAHISRLWARFEAISRARRATRVLPKLTTRKQ